MTEINKDDWINIVRDDGVIFNTLKYDGIDSPKHGYSFEKWEPILNEWCWFISCNNTFELMKFAGKLDNGKYQGKTLHGSIFNYNICEPFIGQLPSKIKDNNK